MLAAQINEYGSSIVVKLNEVPAPDPGPGQVKVKVQAASLNPFDTSVREGYLKEMIPLKFPATLGGDIAGIVDGVGSDVTSVAVGDHVYGQANVVAGNTGAFAEYAVTASGQVAKAPKNLKRTEAASLALAGVSALQGLTEHIKLTAGQKIFIHGGSGAIGSVAIQIAKHLGAYVAATATGDETNYVKGLGADLVIDYKTQDFSAELHGYDAAFDTAGGDDFAKMLQIVRKGGIAVSMIAQPDETKAKELGVTALSERTNVSTSSLDELRGLIESGVVKPRIGKVFPLDQIKGAFDAREGRAVKGKIAIQVS